MGIEQEETGVNVNCGKSRGGSAPPKGGDAGDAVIQRQPVEIKSTF